MATLDKAALLNRRRATKTQDVTLGDGVVIVRGLTRGEINYGRAMAAKGPADRRFEICDNHYIAAGMVEPKLTVAEVESWLADAPAGDSVAVLSAIQELSGLSEGADKSSVARVRKPRGR